MPIPWLRILDLALGVTNVAQARNRPAAGPEQEALVPGSRTLGHLETRLAGVMIAAVKEAFDRDSRRLDLEREHLEAERARAERALRLELWRQAAERETGRLRLVAGVAVVSWLGTLFFSTRILSGTGGTGGRVTLGFGWALLLAALGAAFFAQTRVVTALDRIDEAMPTRDVLGSGLAGAFAPWLIVAGLAVIGVAMLIA
jgi:hypothetical protein